MAAMLEDDDFDQFDKPGAERSRRRRATDDDWDSELEDNLLEEDYLTGKKTSLDLSDEELNDDLLQSDEEEQQDTSNYSAHGVTVSLNATTGDMSSFELSKSLNEECAADFDETENEVIYEEVEELEADNEDLVDVFEENFAVLPDEHVEYGDDETTDEVLDIEINEPMDEFQEEEYSQSYKRQKVTEEQQYVREEQYTEEEYADVSENTKDLQDPESEEVITDAAAESQEFPVHSKEESDEEDDEEEEVGGRIRFKTERKEGTIIRLSDVTRERRNIPETLELSAEAKASLMEFEEMERQRKLGRYGFRRGGRRGGSNSMTRGMGDQRNDNSSNRRNMRDQRSAQGQPIRSLSQQQHIQPLLPIPRSRNPSSDGMTSPKQQGKPRIGTNSRMSTPPQQPKNIHINPHFKGNVTPTQVPLLSVPNQPRPAMGPPRFPGVPGFQHVQSPLPSNFNQPQRHQEPWRNPPPPQPERDPFFMGDPRFSNHHMFEQRNAPPVPPPQVSNSSHSGLNQNQLPFSPPGQGFNQPGPQPRFNQPQPSFNPQPPFNPPGPQPPFNQPNFNQTGPQPGFNPAGPQSGFNLPGPQTGFSPSGNQPGFSSPNFNQPNPQPGFNPPGPQPPFTPPGLSQSGFNQPNPGPQQGFNQPGSGQPNFPPPGPHSGFNAQGFSRERPVRISMPAPNQLGIPPFSQPAPNMRHFPPPRQQFPPGHGQPFIPHNQSNMQSPIQPPMQQIHHHLGGHPKPMSMLLASPFRAQNPQTPSHRMPGQQRHGPPKPRQNNPIQNMVKALSSQMPHPRNSNLRELPIAPAHSLDMNRKKPNSASPAQAKAVGTSAPQTRSASVRNTQMSRPRNTTDPVKEEVKVEEQFPDEDEETRKYRLKIEEQKRLREEILKQKELRRQQQAGARKKELLERLTQQQQSSSVQQGQPEPDKPIGKVENSGSQTLPHLTAQVRPNVKTRLVPQRPELLPTSAPQKIPLLQFTGTNLSFQGQQKKIIKQTLQNRVTPENPWKVQPLGPAVSTPPQNIQQTLKVAPIQGKPQEQRPAGTKRTVMQRSNSGNADGAHIAPKVRVIKIAAGGESASLTTSEDGPQNQPPQQKIQPQQRIPPQQSIPPQQRAQFQQRVQQKTGTVRKVTLGKGSVQQHQTQHFQQQFQVKHQPQYSQMESIGPHVGNIIRYPSNKVIMRGRGRGGGGQMGRGRLMPNKQNLRVVECKPQPCAVSVEGLSSSTTDHQLRNLLMSVGPIQKIQMFPHERKAIAVFESPHHALQFQQRFHRHMVDLSHINVSLIAE